MKPEDYQQLTVYGNCLFFQQNTTDTVFTASVFLTDEANFTKETIFNLHNAHLWELKNPNSAIPIFKYGFLWENYVVRISYSALNRVKKVFLTLQCYVIPNRLCALCHFSKFVQLMVNHPAYVWNYILFW